MISFIIRRAVSSRARQNTHNIQHSFIILASLFLEPDIFWGMLVSGRNSHSHLLFVLLIATGFFLSLPFKKSVVGFEPPSLFTTRSSFSLLSSSSSSSSTTATTTTTALRMTSSNPTPPPTPIVMKASINMAMSVDGYIATKEGNVDWLNNQPPPNSEEGDLGFMDFLNSVDVIIMGKNSFNKVVSFGQDMYAYGDKKLIVWTRDPSTVIIPDYLLQKGCVTTSSLDPKSLLEKLANDEDTNCKHAYIDGGITIQKFLQAKLIQRMSITRIPILLGSGIPLFANNEDCGEQFDLKHIKTTSYSNGFVTTIYDVIY